MSTSCLIGVAVAADAGIAPVGERLFDVQAGASAEVVGVAGEQGRGAFLLAVGGVADAVGGCGVGWVSIDSKQTSAVPARRLIERAMGITCEASGIDCIGCARSAIRREGASVVRVKAFGSALVQMNTRGGFEP